MSVFGNSTYIIAEAGVNHNGSLELACKLVDVAVQAGANAVKFQTFKADKIVIRSARKAEYQTQTTNAEESQYEMLKKLELSEADFLQLSEYCKEREIVFASTGFDRESIDFLNKLGIQFFKIPSGEIINLPYLRHIGKLNKPVVMSTGMATLGEIEFALSVLNHSGLALDQITILHCNTEYPTPYRDVNLKAMITMRSAFPGVKVGYSDHTLGIEVPIAAVAMGARVIEKHLTLDRSMAGPDHAASLEPDELKLMVASIRNIEAALGSPIKQPSPSEIKNLQIARKSIVAAKVIKAGEVFTEDNLDVKRPGGGISPMRWDEILGRKAITDFAPDEAIAI